MRILTSRAAFIASIGLVGLSFVSVHAVQQKKAAWPPEGARKTPEKAPTLSAEEELKTFVLPPGYRAELVAKEPLADFPVRTLTFLSMAFLLVVNRKS